MALNRLLLESELGPPRHRLFALIGATKLLLGSSKNLGDMQRLMRRLQILITAIRAEPPATTPP